MARPLLRSLALGCALAALVPASASAAPMLTEACFLICSATVTGDSGNDDITIQINPNVANGTRFVAKEASGVAWTINLLGGSCTQSVNSGTNTIDCDRNWFGVTVNSGNGNDTVVNTRDYVGGVVMSGGEGADSLRQTTSLTSVLNANGGAADDQLVGGTAADPLTGGEGNDSLTGGDGDDALSAGGGGDTVNGGNGKDGITAGAGDDTVTGGGGDDTIDGGAGRDRITPGVGVDDVKGGEGFDEARYTDRSAAVSLSLDDQANDGVDGEGDNLHVDVEDLVGGGGGDTITGNEQDNVLDGGAGDDVITGAAGTDTFVGGEGKDTLQARDGAKESVDCGAEDDRAVGDEIDQLVDCEVQDLSADLVADFDGDGFVKPGDCNDANAAIRPNATDVPDNGVDENCDGADAVNPDRDGDGVTRPADCDDSNRAVRPGAAEILGNALDEDCSGLADPFPSITSSVLNSFTAFAAFTRIDLLKVRDVPAGASVQVVCSGRGCPRRSFKRTVRSRTRLLDVRRPFRRSRLRAKARIEVRITKPETIGRVVRFTMRRRAVPSTTSLCLPPGKTKAEEC